MNIQCRVFFHILITSFICGCQRFDSIKPKYLNQADDVIHVYEYIPTLEEGAIIREKYIDLVFPEEDVENVKSAKIYINDEYRHSKQFYDNVVTLELESAPVGEIEIRLELYEGNDVGTTSINARLRVPKSVYSTKIEHYSEPLLPVNITKIVSTDNQITITWSGSQDPLFKSYSLQRMGVKGFETIAIISDIGTTSFSDSPPFDFIGFIRQIYRIEVSDGNQAVVSETKELKYEDVSSIKFFWEHFFFNPVNNKVILSSMRNIPATLIEYNIENSKLIFDRYQSLSDHKGVAMGLIGDTEKRIVVRDGDATELYNAGDYTLVDTFSIAASGGFTLDDRYWMVKNYDLTPLAKFNVYDIALHHYIMSDVWANLDNLPIAYNNGQFILKYHNEALGYVVEDTSLISTVKYGTGVQTAFTSEDFLVVIQSSDPFIKVVDLQTSEIRKTILLDENWLDINNYNIYGKHLVLVASKPSPNVESMVLTINLETEEIGKHYSFDVMEQAIALGANEFAAIFQTADYKTQGLRLFQ